MNKTYFIRFAFQVGGVLLTRRVIGTGTVEDIQRLFEAEIPEARFVNPIEVEEIVLSAGANATIQFLNV